MEGEAYAALYPVLDAGKVDILFCGHSAFNAYNAAPARCARNCNPNDPNTQPYTRPTTLNQQSTTTTATCRTTP